MSYLLRVELPDVPGSLGRLASAIGAAGGNIDAIEIVERSEGHVIDNVFLAAEPGMMPDSIVSACTSQPDVRVLWISRYAAGSNLTRDLEVVEAMTTDPDRARDILVDLIPATFVVDWAARLRRVEASATILHGTTAAPTQIPQDMDMTWPQDLARGGLIAVPERYADLLVAGCALGEDEIVVMARRGGPEILASEVARLSHLSALAASIAR